MKLYEIRHINESHNPNKIMGMELRFTHSICSTSGKNYPAEKQPDDWQHVRRLAHMLFLAWNDDNPVEPVVYLGEFYNPESEDEKFYKFFEQFNKFPINDKQKRIYSMIKNGGHVDVGRQCGVTVLLLTIAAYESVINDKFVVYFAHNQDIVKLYEREFRNKWNSSPFLFPKSRTNIVFRSFSTDMNIFRGHSNVATILDNNWLHEKYNTFKNIEQHQKYKYVTKPIPNFKEYSINTLF